MGDFYSDCSPVHKKIYKDFCEWSPDYAAMVIDYKPWGHTSIVVWLSNGYAYKVKQHAHDRFTMQMVSEADIERKLDF